MRDCVTVKADINGSTYLFGLTKAKGYWEISGGFNASLATCLSNMKRIDNAIMTYYADTGEWPDSSILTSELIYTTYLKGEPICPCGKASYVWHESVNGEAPYVTCPNIDKYPDHSL